MDDILKLLKTDMLTEAEANVLKEKLELLVADKVNEKVEEKIVVLKEELEAEYEEKLSKHIDEVTANFSDFMDKVIDEELEIPTSVIEFAKKGELYSDLIEDFKVRLSIDEGYLTDEIKETMVEAKNEIENLKDQLNNSIDEAIELREDNKKLTAIAYINEKCDGLTVVQKSKVVSLLDGLFEKSEIDRKFDLIVETFGITEAKSCKNEEDDEEDQGQQKQGQQKQKQKQKQGQDDEEEDLDEEGQQKQGQQKQKQVSQQDDEDVQGKGQKEVEKEIEDEEDKEKQQKNEGFNSVLAAYKKILTEKV